AHLRNHLLWALATAILRQGSFAKDQSGYICLIEDPKQNQCDSICLTELIPRLNEVVKAQNQGNKNIRESDNEIKSRLETLEVKIEEVQTKLPQEVHAKVEGQLQGLREGQTKLEGQQTKMEVKLEDSLLAVKTKLEGQELEGQLQGVKAKMEGQLQEGQNRMMELHAKLEINLFSVQDRLESRLEGVLFKIENQLQAVSKKIDAAAKVEAEVHPVLNKTAALQQAVPALAPMTIPSGFELFGSRHFRIVKENTIWDTAEGRCREMGGYLASFRNEEEINAIKPKLSNGLYWLGINDRENEAHYVSVASQKPTPFLNWDEDEPSDWTHEQNCVFLENGKMGDAFCNAPLFFICQADNET
ncbi:hypothetical protein KR059_004864, partial [Drosophila kikkawai]